jgi:hypothetical protein
MAAIFISHSSKDNEPTDFRKEDAAVFFGRSDKISKSLAKLNSLRRNDCYVRQQGVAWAENKFPVEIKATQAVRQP